MALYGLLMPIFFAHVLTWTTARAGWGFLRRKAVHWDSLERGGQNVVKQEAPADPIAVAMAA